jgi:hypothetical protein
MWVDASPVKRSFLRFWTHGLAGRTVTGARLRLRQLDASSSGGRVRAVASTSWPESVTWSGRPALGADVLATIGPVATGDEVTVELPPSVVRDGVWSLGMDSASSDGARWATAESATPPRLELDLEPPAGGVVDGLGVVAGVREASSDPTAIASNHRVALTPGGRMLTVFGRHADGLRLAWRDPAGSWTTRSTGASEAGTVLGGTGTGDWLASVAVDGDRAWVVISGLNPDAKRTVRVRRLTELDAPEGPRIGELVELDAPAVGAFRADVAVHGGRGRLLWSRQTGETSFEVVAGAFDLDAAAPEVQDPMVLYRSTSSARWGTLVAGEGRLRAVLRGSSNRLTTYTFAGPGAWTRGVPGPVISSRSAPAGVALPDGGLLVAVEQDVSNHVTTVERFSADGDHVGTEQAISGLGQPTIATHDGRVVLVGIRWTTKQVVSRERAADGAWTTADRVEIGAEGRPPLKHPNALPAGDGRLRLVVEGPDFSVTRGSVLGYQRPF